jgi:hypothetical protein
MMSRYYYFLFFNIKTKCNKERQIKIIRDNLHHFKD